MGSSLVRPWVGLVAVMTSVASVAPLHAQTMAVGGPPKSEAAAALVSITVNDVPLKQVLKTIARQAGLTPFYSNEIEKSERKITLQLQRVSAAEAFKKALEGTGMRASVVGDAVVFEEDGLLAVRAVQGGVTGKVIDAKTRQGLRGASITLSGTNKGTTSREDGSFRIADVTVGSYTVQVRMLGYVKTSQQTTVVDGQTASVNFVLEPSVNALDQVVVTGTVIETQLKAVPNAITVITARDIEQRGITKIDQLFRGDVPGLFAVNAGSSSPLDEVTMFSRGATALSELSVGVSTLANNTNAIKTYIDGVEMADPKYLSQIDPKSIERIEILTGPQASTIYGSNAMNGVMQIFTNRGRTAARPQLTLNLLSGWVENDFSPACTPQHDYSGQLSGIEGRVSYNAGGSWNYMGPWTPSRQTARLDGFGGARLTFPTSLGTAQADVSLRQSVTTNRQRGPDVQSAIQLFQTGWYDGAPGGAEIPMTSTLTGRTIGVTLGYTPTNWWSHELNIGQDISDTETRSEAPTYGADWDTLLTLSQGHNDRRSLRYTTTARITVTTAVQATVTLGADAWQNITTSLFIQPTSLTGSLTSGYSWVQRQPGHNRGGFLQTQLGIADRLFLTYGLRAEWNPTFGEDAEPNYSPRYGIAYTHDLMTPWGALTAKLRASYGRSTRPPAPTLKNQFKVGDFHFGGLESYYVDEYGNFDWYLANPALGPEYQQGGEGGLELYFGNRGSLVVTRYNQTVDELIASPMIDSIRSLLPFPIFYYSMDDDGYGYTYRYQYVNLGSIRNQGWELQGSMNAGPLTARGTYSWTKSRSIGVSPRYRAQFPPEYYPQYQPGATFRYLPEHTWALGLTYARAGTTVTANLTGFGQRLLGANQGVDRQDEFSAEHLDFRIRLLENRYNMSGMGRYINMYGGQTLADVTATHRFTTGVDAVLQIQNVADQYAKDIYSAYAVMGRQVKAGLRLRY